MNYHNIYPEKKKEKKIKFFLTTKNVKHNKTIDLFYFNKQYLYFTSS